MRDGEELFADGNELLSHVLHDMALRRPDSQQAPRPACNVPIMQPPDILQRQYCEALRDLDTAVPLLRRDWLEAPSGRVASLSTAGMTVPEEVVLLALAYDGIGLAQGQLGDWGAAVDSHARAVGGDCGGRRSIRGGAARQYGILRAAWLCWWVRLYLLSKVDDCGTGPACDATPPIRVSQVADVPLPFIRVIMLLLGPPPIRVNQGTDASLPSPSEGTRRPKLPMHSRLKCNCEDFQTLAPVS